MGVFEEILKCTSYKAVYMHESHSAYIWQNGECKYYQNLSQEQVDLLKSLSELANKSFHIPNQAFGFTS